MRAEDILKDVGDFCRRAAMAESTFGRLAVNDGKLIARLRGGGRITTTTLNRIRAFMNSATAAARSAASAAMNGAPSALTVGSRRASGKAAAGATDQDDPQRNFRFFDNRQKYLLFVNTCSEKWVIAQRVGLELANIHPRPPAVRVFDAGLGDGTVRSEE